MRRYVLHIYKGCAQPRMNKQIHTVVFSKYGITLKGEKWFSGRKYGHENEKTPGKFVAVGGEAGTNGR